MPVESHVPVVALILSVAMDGITDDIVRVLVEARRQAQKLAPPLVQTHRERAVLL